MLIVVIILDFNHRFPSNRSKISLKFYFSLKTMFFNHISIENIPRNFLGKHKQKHFINSEALVTSVSNQLFQHHSHCCYLFFFWNKFYLFNFKFNAQFKKMLNKIVELSFQSSALRSSGLSTKSQVVPSWKKYKKSSTFGSSVGSLLRPKKHLQLLSNYDIQLSIT